MRSTAIILGCVCLLAACATPTSAGSSSGAGAGAELNPNRVDTISLPDGDRQSGILTPALVMEVVEKACLPDVFDSSADFDTIVAAGGAESIANPIYPTRILNGDFPATAWAFPSTPRLFFFQTKEAAAGVDGGCTIGVFDGDLDLSIMSFVSALNTGMAKYTGQSLGFDVVSSSDPEMSYEMLEQRNLLNGFVEVQSPPKVIRLLTTAETYSDANAPDREHVGALFSMMSLSVAGEAN